MYLTYNCTVSGEPKRVELIEFKQDKTAKWYAAEAYSLYEYFTINRYKHLWRGVKCIGTQVEIVK